MQEWTGKLALGKVTGLKAWRSKSGDKPVAPVTNTYGTPHDSSEALVLLKDFENSGLGWFWSTNADGEIVYISSSIATQIGKSAEELVGQPFTSLFVLERGEDNDNARTLPLLFNTHKTITELPMQIAVQGDELWLAVSGRPQLDSNGTFIGYRGNGSDITENRRKQRDAERLAQYDSLTGLANRHRMGKRLETTLAAYCIAKRSCAVMMMDLDRFKQVNDTLGHPAGDELLKQVAQRLERIIDKNCEIGRLGGDEFQIIVPDMDDRGKLGELAKTIISMVSQPYSIDTSRCVIGASIGIAIAPYDGINREEIIRNADLALYAAKGGGRGQFRFYTSELHSLASEKRLLEDALRDALAKEELRLVYQPLVDTKTEVVLGFEVLMRWEHPELGAISPATFIPIAEETHLIGALGEWALRQACMDMAQLPSTLRVAVNVSPAQFANIEFPTVVASALAHAEISPDRLELELTESIFLSSGDATDRMFGALKKLGVRLALDDFGTGYSSLAYLKTAPFDKIKIDQSFIRDVTKGGNRNRAIVAAIVSLADALGLDTTAEGIETFDQLDAMRELKVKQIQGYIYSKPIPFTEVLEQVGTGQWKIRPEGDSTQRSDRISMLRRVGLIHEDHRYDVTMRNLSRSGAMIEGLIEIPLGTMFVLDLGEGQLAVSKVRRSKDDNIGLEFETELVDDGAGGLCTRHRISPYQLAAAGMPLASLPPGQYPLVGQQKSVGLPKFGTSNDKHAAAAWKDVQG